MLFLWVFGDNVEDAMGHLKFLVFYLLCGVAGGLAHAWLLPTSPQLPLDRRQRGGCRRDRGLPAASARSRLGAGVPLHPACESPRLWVLGTLGRHPARSWCCSHQADQVAWWAHIGGMAAGAVLILFMRRPGVPAVRPRPATAGRRCAVMRTSYRGRRAVADRATAA